MPDTMTIAHLTDVHLSPIVGFTPRHWNAKRALGFINWQRKRQHIHQRSIVDRLVTDMKAQAPDHIAITGDLINIGLPAEYEAAHAWLATVGTPSDVSLVPGNHDIYTTLRGHPGHGRWNAYMQSDAWGLSQGAAASGSFPYVRRIGSIAIIGLCSAVPTAPGIATGRIGPEQLDAARRILAKVGQERIFRLVMIHHPPLPGQSRVRHDLTDAAALAQVLADSGAELVLHGHNHRPMAARVPWTGGSGTGGHAHIIGAASASAVKSNGTEPLARYNLVRISGRHGQWQIEVRQRGLQLGQSEIIEIERSSLV